MTGNLVFADAIAVRELLPVFKLAPAVVTLLRIFPTVSARRRGLLLLDGYFFAGGLLFVFGFG